MLCQYLTCHTKLFLWKYIMIFHMKCESQRFSCKKSIIFTFIELMKACEPSMNLLQHKSGTYHEHIISFDFRVLVVLYCHLKATSKKYRYVQQKVLMCDFFIQPYVGMSGLTWTQSRDEDDHCEDYHVFFSQIDSQLVSESKFFIHVWSVSPNSWLTWLPK